MPFIDVASATPENTIPVVLDKPSGSVRCQLNDIEEDVFKTPINSDSKL